ncbi:MAG: hypothetical protein HC767_12940 [Akkermansiaceae bacterium]|nr:hypothetical protein [Akkermansiaceae bacterium]
MVFEAEELHCTAEEIDRHPFARFICQRVFPQHHADQVIGWAIISKECSDSLDSKIAENFYQLCDTIADERHHIAEETAENLAAAKIKLGEKRYDEALTRIVGALEMNPASSVAKDLFVQTLTKTTWTFPEITITHAVPIDQLSFAAPSSLWVNLGGKTNTTVFWDLETMELKSVLFPHLTGKNRNLLAGPQGQLSSFSVEKAPCCAMPKL